MGPWSVVILGGLSNDDDDGKQNGKKTIGLDWQNNNFASASRFFVHFFAVAAGLRRESAKFHVLSKDLNTRQRLSFSFSELCYSCLEFNSRKKIANISRIERVGISAIKFEVAQIHILTDLVVGVAVVVA